MFCQSKHICVLNQNTFVFCHMPDNCFHILCTVMQIKVSSIGKMTSAHIGRPLCHCQRHVGAVVITAMAAALLPPLPLSSLPLKLPLLPHSPRRHQHRFCCCCYRFMVDCCLPLCCLCFGHRCLPSRLPLLAANTIATTTVLMAANRCPLLLLLQPGDVQNITFKVIF